MGDRVTALCEDDQRYYLSKVLSIKNTNFYKCLFTDSSYSDDIFQEHIIVGFLRYGLFEHAQNHTC